MPRSGLFCLLASALFLSVFGRPVPGSFGCLSQTRFPHSAPPQLTIRTWPSLSPVNQMPSASAACTGATGFAAAKTTDESQTITERTVAIGITSFFTALGKYVLSHFQLPRLAPPWQPDVPLLRQYLGSLLPAAAVANQLRPIPSGLKARLSGPRYVPALAHSMSPRPSQYRGPL